MHRWKPVDLLEAQKAIQRVRDDKNHYDLFVQYYWLDTSLVGIVRSLPALKKPCFYLCCANSNGTIRQVQKLFDGKPFYLEATPPEVTVA